MDRRDDLSNLKDILADDGRHLSAVQVAQVHRLLAGQTPAIAYAALQDAYQDAPSPGAAVIVAGDCLVQVTFTADGAVEAILDRLPLRRAVIHLPDERPRNEEGGDFPIPGDDFPRGTKLTLVLAGGEKVELPPEGAREEYAQRTALGDLYRYFAGDDAGPSS